VDLRADKARTALCTGRQCGCNRLRRIRSITYPFRGDLTTCRSCLNEPIECGPPLDDGG
jgi:hypothetical protein